MHSGHANQAAWFQGKKKQGGEALFLVSRDP
jgi:hypothetical protein